MAICIPRGIGVPYPTGPNTYAMSGPPIWWDPTEEKDAIKGNNISLEDPRWMGSVKFGYPDAPGVPTDDAFFGSSNLTGMGFLAGYLACSPGGRGA